MPNKPRVYVIIWANEKTGAQEPWYVDGPRFFGFMRSMNLLEEVWTAMMQASKENALHWVGKEKEDGNLG